MAGIGRAHLRDVDTALRAEGVVVEYDSGGAILQAVSDVSLDVLAGETLGIVGESGCGKSSLGRALMQLPRPRSGSVCLEGEDLTTLDHQALRRSRSRLQMIFQDPLSSMNPKRSVHEIVSEPLRIWRRKITAEDEARVRSTLESVGLDPDQVWNRRPRELSGGQCQRVCIARALMAEPHVLICDEPVSALDVSVQAQILNLLEDTKRRSSLSLVFIAHDLAVVKNISDRILVMYLGRVCEVGPSAGVYATAAHPYTRVLLSSVPDPDPDVAGPAAEIVGEMPSPLDPPSGCRFRTRCPAADAVCANVEPQMRELSAGHYVACHHPVLA